MTTNGVSQCKVFGLDACQRLSLLASETSVDAWGWILNRSLELAESGGYVCVAERQVEIATKECFPSAEPQPASKPTDSARLDEVREKVEANARKAKAKKIMATAKLEFMVGAAKVLKFAAQQAKEAAARTVVKLDDE